MEGRFRDTSSCLFVSLVDSKILSAFICVHLRFQESFSLFPWLKVRSNMPIRVLHLADLHLGVENYGRFDPQRGFSSRVGDFLRALDAAVERAADVDLVVIAGDVYK